MSSNHKPAQHFHNVIAVFKIICYDSGRNILVRVVISLYMAVYSEYFLLKFILGSTAACMQFLCLYEFPICRCTWICILYMFVCVCSIMFYQCYRMQDFWHLNLMKYWQPLFRVWEKKSKATEWSWQPPRLYSTHWSSPRLTLRKKFVCLLLLPIPSLSLSLLPTSLCPPLFPSPLTPFSLLSLLPRRSVISSCKSCVRPPSVTMFLCK